MPTTIPLGPLKPKTSTGYNFTNPAEGLAQIVSNLLGFMTILAGVAFLIYFMFGAINWIMSAGDPQKAAAAKTSLTNALLGLVIAVAAYPLALLISRLIGVPLADPQQLIDNLFH